MRLACSYLIPLRLCRCLLPTPPCAPAVAFRLYDAERRGSISPANVKFMLAHSFAENGIAISDPAVDKIVSDTFRQYDTDRDGRVSRRMPSPLLLCLVPSLGPPPPLPSMLSKTNPVASSLPRCSRSPYAFNSPSVPLPLCPSVPAHILLQRAQLCGVQGHVRAAAQRDAPPHAERL